MARSVLKNEILIQIMVGSTDGFLDKEVEDGGHCGE